MTYNPSVGRRASAKWAKSHPEQVRQKHFKEHLKQYGLTPEQYFELLARQGGACAICRSTTPKTKRTDKMFVDHNHSTGEVRGLLCHPCNIMLGNAEDSPARLRLAAEYLEQWNG